MNTAMYAMHDMVQCIGTKSGFVNATKSGRISVQGKVLKSAFNAYKHFICPEHTYSREDKDKHEAVLNTCRINTWTKLQKVLDEYQLRFNLASCDFGIPDGVELPKEIVQTIQRAFVSVDYNLTNVESPY